MASKDNYMFGKDGNFYRRVLGGSCKDCTLPQEYCSRVKCKESQRRFHWIQDEEMFKKYIESLTPEELENLSDEIVHCIK